MKKEVPALSEVGVPVAFHGLMSALGKKSNPNAMLAHVR
jgi:hypothetical protein